MTDTTRIWQPIETAPKNGTEFLGWCGDGYFLARWLQSENGKSPGFYDSIAHHPFGHQDGDDTPWCHLTHWMPLPVEPDEDDN